MDEDGVPLMVEDGVPWRSDAKRGVGIIKVTWRRDRLTSRDSGEDWTRSVILYWICTGNEFQDWHDFGRFRARSRGRAERLVRRDRPTDREPSEERTCKAIFE